MSKHDSKEVDLATLHEAIFTYQTGTVGPQLQNWTDSTRKAVKMTLCEPWVSLEIPDSKNAKVTHNILVPVTGFKQVRLAVEKNSKA